MIINTLFLIFSLIGAGAMFFDYKKVLPLRYKIIFLIMILSAYVALMVQENARQKAEAERWSNAQWMEDMRNRNLTEAMRNGSEKKKKSLLEIGMPETAQSFLDHNYSRLQNLLGTNKKIGEQCLTNYFSEVSKIPNFYTWEEWKETEVLLFKNMRESLKGYFISRNPYDKDHGKAAVDEFVKEREKYVKAKEREFNKKKCAP